MNEPVKTKKPVIVFSIADERNKPYADKMLASLRKFHPDIPYHLVEGAELQTYLKADPMFFYRATPIIAEKFIKDYELVIKIDADSIIVGSLDYLLNTKDFDVFTVINWNRADAQEFPLVAGWGILPIEYFNAGLVGMRSEKFVHDWKIQCFSPQFDRMQYKEQDILNAICYFGNYNVRCGDHGDGPAGMMAWWGLLSKGEWSRAILKGEKIIVPKGEGPTPFPIQDMELKVLHWGGGQDSPEKLNYRTRFNEEIVTYLDKLVK